MGKTSGTEREVLGASQLRAPRSGDRSKSRWSEPPLRFEALPNGGESKNLPRETGPCLRHGDARGGTRGDYAASG